MRAIEIFAIMYGAGWAAVYGLVLFGVFAIAPVGGVRLDRALSARLFLSAAALAAILLLVAVFVLPGTNP